MPGGGRKGGQAESGVAGGRPHVRTPTILCCVQTDRRAQTDPDRARTAQRPAGGNAPAEAHRTPRLRLRPALLRGVRARRGAAGPVHRGRVGVPLQPLDRRRGRGADVHRGRLVPAERARLPERRRRLRGGQHQPRAQGGPDRRQRAARRLRPDRRRLDLLRHREPRLRGALRRRAQGALRDRRDRAADADEPARGEGVRLALRDPDLRLRLGRLHHDRVGGVPRAGPRRHHAGTDGGLPDQARAPGPGRLRAGLPAAARLLLRLCRAHRCRGDLQRRTRPSASPSRRTRRPRSR